MDCNHAVKGSEVFVGGLPRTVTESKIHEIFDSCGEILEIRMMRDQNGGSKGFCFVRFTMKEAAAKAIREKSNFLLEGKRIGVLPSNDQDSIFLGNLRKDWSADDFDKLVNQAAARAYRVGSKSDFLLGGWHPVVQWAKTEPEIDPEELAKTRIAFVRNLPTDADEDYVKRLFERLGKLEKVVVSRKGSSTAGFVHFGERLDFEKAIKEMNGKVVQGPNGGPTFKLQVEVAKPLDKKGKRARDESNCRPASTSLRVSKLSRVDLTSNSPGHFMPIAPKVHHLIEEPDTADPYEATVVSLPVAVKERLLRIMRLGIATRFDIDIHCLSSLNEIPESSAISVLDQFLLSGADRQHKGAYLVGLISKYQVDRLRQNRSLQLSSSGGIASVESMLPRSSDRVHLSAVASLTPCVGITAARHGSLISSSRVLSPYSSLGLDPPLSHLMRYSQMKSVSPEPLRRTPVPASTSTTQERYLQGVPFSARYGNVGLDPYITACVHSRQSANHQVGLDSYVKASAHSHQSANHQVRFDPFTGEPYKFDPFTGELIQPETPSHPAGSRYW